MIEFEHTGQILGSSCVFSTYKMVVEVGGRKFLRDMVWIGHVGADLKFICIMSYAFEVEI